MTFGVYVIGASHLVQCRLWTELLSCSDMHLISPVLSLGPDFNDEKLFSYQDSELCYSFEIEIQPMGELEELKQICSELSNSKIIVNSEFSDKSDKEFSDKSDKEVNRPPPVTYLGVNPLDKGLEVRSFHYYSQESFAVISRSLMRIR